jgi:hypothetical protein
VGARSFVRFGRSKGRALTTTAPPRSRTTADLVTSMTRFARMTQTDARRVLSELEQGGWIVGDGDEWRATPQARAHFAGIMWQVGEEGGVGPKADYGWARKIA